MPGGKLQLPALLRKQQTSLFLGVVLLDPGGTIGFTFIEGWPLFDSFYMTILTVSTVGYGEVHPLSGPAASSPVSSSSWASAPLFIHSLDWARLSWKENFKAYWEGKG